MSLSRAFKKSAERVLNFLFPEKESVAAARRVVEEKDRRALESLPILGKVPIPDTYALFPYWEPLVRDILWLFKYRSEQDAAKLFAPLLCKHIIFPILKESGQETSFLIPMPLSKERLRERGFNQASVLAARIGEESGGKLIPLEGVLVRNKKTEHQARLKNREGREKNVVNSFVVEHPHQIAGKQVFLIDDIVTTGATSGEARKALLAAGASKVTVIALAH